MWSAIFQVCLPCHGRNCPKTHVALIPDVSKYCSTLIFRVKRSETSELYERYSVDAPNDTHFKSPNFFYLVFNISLCSVQHHAMNTWDNGGIDPLIHKFRTSIQVINLHILLPPKNFQSSRCRNEILSTALANWGVGIRCLACSRDSCFPHS